MINHDKAYIIGLLVGNGTISKGTFAIRLSFKNWGMHPEKMNKIARDILTKIHNKFKSNYNFNLTYEIGNGLWIIKPIGNPDISSLLHDLNELGLPDNGFLLEKASLKTARQKLKGIHVESFLSGIFDTRASLTKSHRRFTDNAPVVSLEIPGSTMNFEFVVSICSWLTELGSTTDQILFNHPCQHSPSDPGYKSWKKGFKIRFLVNSFLAKHSFALKAKAIDIEALKQLQEKNEQKTCINRKINKPNPVGIHNEINADTLPILVQNKLFFHYHHFCAVLGCKYAPINEIEKIVRNYTEFIFVLPRLEKGEKGKIGSSFDQLNSKHLNDFILTEETCTVEEALKDETLRKYFDFHQGLAYLFSAQLKGKRHVGSMNEIFKINRQKSLVIRKPIGEKLPTLFIYNTNNDRAILISAISGELNQKLIQKHIVVRNLDVIYK